ncbi:MAG: SPOR domain-containing protein [Pseudomonadota bacterium]
MKSRISALALALCLSACGGDEARPEMIQPPAYAGPVASAGQDIPSHGGQPGGPPPSEGPQGTSQGRPGEERYDEVGYALAAGYDDAPTGAVVAASPRVAPGSFVEVTELNGGRTVLMLVDRGSGDASKVLMLSPGAARELGVVAGVAVPVRVRMVTPTAQDQGALRAGRPASARLDAPPALTKALAKRLPDTILVTETPAPSSPRPVRPRPAATRPATPSAARGGFYVQVAALSNRARADEVARGLGGFVKPGGKLYRIQMGPYPTAAAAEAGRAEAARRGFPDARVFRMD